GDVMKVKATYQLDNQGLSVFQATLPAKAELWGVDVQGRGVKPMAKGQHVRIALPQQGRGLVTVRLHYSIKLADSLPARSGAIKIFAPKVSYPIIQSAWMVYAPHRYRPVGMRSPFPVSGVLKPRALVETIVKVVKRYPNEVFILVLFLLGLILRVHLLALLSWMFHTFVWLVRELFVSPWRWGTALSALLVIGVLSTGVLISKDMSPRRLAKRYEMPPTNNLREESKSGGKSRWRTKATKKKKEARHYRKKKTYDFDDDTVSGSLRRSGRGGGRPQGNFALKSPPRKARRYRRRRPAAPRSAPRRVTSRLNQPTELPKIVAKPKPIPESIVKAPPPPPAQDGQPIVTTPKKQAFLPPGKDSKPKSGELDRIEDQKSKNAQKMGEKVRDLIRSEGLLGKKGKVEKKEDGKGRHDALRQQAKHRFKRPDGSKSTLTLVDKEKAQRLANTKRVLDGNFDARLMRGIRSLEVKEAPMGWWIRTAGLGALEEVQVTLWREEWLRTSLIIVFLFAFLLWFVLGTLMASRRALLVVGGVLLTAAAGFLVQGVWVLFANALTAGILAAGLLLVLRKQVSGAVAAIVLFGLLSGATPQAHAASPDCQWFTITQNAVKYPSKVSLYAAYQKGKTPSLRGKTPVFVPYTWWAMLGRAPEPRCFRVPKAAAYWVQTAYKAKILSAKRSVEGIASFDVRILKKGTYRIPLGLSGVSAKLLKTSFPLALGYGKRGYEVVLSGPGRFVIPLSFTVPLHTKRQLSLSLAKHAVAGMRLELDGTKWSFRSPQAAEGMHVASTKNKTFVHILLGGEKKLQVSWRPSSLKGQTEIENANVLSYHHVTLRQHLLRFRSRYLFRRRYQKTTRFIFDMPAKASLEAVRSKDLRSWRYQTQKGNKQLVVVLEKPVKTADIVVRYVLLRKKLKEKWALPFLRPNQIARHRGFLGFRADGVQSTLLGTAGMEKQSAAEYRSSTSAWGGAVTEAFAFRQLPSLQIVLRPKVSKLRVRASQMMVIGAQRDQLSSEMTIRGDVSEQFTLSFLLSKGWTIREVRSLRGVPVRQTWMGQATKTHQILFVEFKRPVMRGQKLLIQAERWSDQTLRVFPTLVPSRVHELRGTLAIAAPVDYELQTEALKSLKTRERYGLRPVGLRLPEQTKIQLGYTFQRRYSGQLRWEKKQETSRCKGTFHVDIYESTALLTGKLHFRASGVGVRQWSFSVPTALAKRIEIKTAPGVKLTRKASKGRTLFTLRHALLRTSFLQSLRLRLDVSRKGVVSIPSIQPEGTISHVSWLFLRKTPQVRLFVEKPKGAGIRPLLPASMNRKSMGKDVVSAFEIKRGGWTLSVRREVLKTEVSFRPLVELGHLETTFTEQGQAWTRATYTLRSAGLQFLTFSLPRGGSLWSVRVRGKVVYPTKNAGVYMIPLPPRQSSDLAYDIECLYAHKVQLPSVFGSVTLQPPHIAPVEVSQTYWTVYAPKSWRVRSHSGNMDRATLMQMEVAQLKRSFDFFHKLQKLAHTGDAVEKARAKANIKRQWSEVQNTLKRARQQMNTLRYRKKNNAVKKSYRQSRTQFYRLSGAIRADSAKANRYLRQSRQSTHALTVWQRKFGVSLQSADKAVGQRKTMLATLSFLRTGKRSTYATGGGRPTLSLHVSRAGLTKTILGWAGWVLLLLVFLIAGWRRWL
ncbi:MAG TPA: hypothetical protein DCE42_04120, partial [Myxococcales bacterium]|nr:hypothetical protein [Myxococcales bacterium]